MADKKKQHYVPKGYFRNFSENEKVNVFVIESLKLIENVPIDGQGFEDYFYSHNTGIEDSFAGIENKCLPILRKLIDSESIEITFDEKMSILTFFNFQHKRTPKVKRAINDSIKMFTDDIIKSVLKTNTPKVELKLPYSHLMAIHNSLFSAITTSDLCWLLIKNKTPISFLISDHPIVFYNSRFCNIEGGHEGTQSPGLQIFCPLSKDLLLILYDSTYYYPSPKMDKISVSREEDIKKLNRLQFHNCDKYIYSFGNNPELIREIHKFKEEYKKDKFLANLAKFYDASRPDIEILRVGTENIREKLKFPFLRFKQIASYPDKLYRNLELINTQKDIQEKLENSLKEKLAKEEKSIN